jgi:D-apionolactonase
MTRLRAGDLSARLVGADLFAVTWRGTEVLQRLYYAVRDAPWNTIPGRLTHTAVERSDDHFVIRLQQEHRYQDIDVDFAAEIEGTADGILVYRVDSMCRGDFMYSKIGLNLHHGMDQYRQRPFAAATQEGRLEGRFAEEITPQLIRDGSLTAMFPHFDALEVDLGEVAVRFDFEGDRFETQDHRNWCDANWKTYGTPLEYGFPMPAKRGATLSQVVRLTCSGGSAHLARGPVGATQVTLGGSGNGRLPAVGVALSDVPHEHVVSALRSLECSYVQFTLPGGQHPDAAVATCRRVSEAVGVPLELVVPVVPEHAADGAAELVEAIARGGVPLARLVCLVGGEGFSEFRGATPPEIVAPFAERCAARLPDVPVASGTGQSYNVIARDRPAYPPMVGIAFAATPQIHASDDTSVMQNARAFAEVVADCRRLYPGRSVAVTPVHLAAAAGPYPAGPPESEDDRPQDDPRHASVFGAAWAIAALASLARATTDSVTLFDGIGPRGVISTNGSRHPVGSVIAMLGGLHGRPVRSADVSTPDAVGVLDVEGPDGRVIFVANLRSYPQDVVVRSAPEPATLRYVDDVEPAGSARLAPRVVGDDVVLCLGAYTTSVLEQVAPA